MTCLPDGLLIAFYGDDLTGSTDTMEVLTFAGLETVLFLQTPTIDQLARFPNARAVGIAGVSRARDPAWMETELPASFSMLAALGAPVLHYKVCSTFDSSPTIGSIGKAIDIGVYHAEARWTPVIVGAPRLRRFQAFGNLFATVDGIGYRLDRHPTMARHPVTPMNEADLRLHLCRQTARRIELIDYLALKSRQGDARLSALAGGDRPAVLIDVLDEETLEAAGRLVWENRGTGLFTASSSGLEYALVAYWQAAGLLERRCTPRPATPVDRIAVVSGSCSPVTQGQIDWAQENGFQPIRIAAERFVGGGNEAKAEVARTVEAALSALSVGKDPIVFSAHGPADPAIAAVADAAKARGVGPTDATPLIGQGLADVMTGILDAVPLRRICVAGGDTSGAVAGALDLFALEALAPLAPGSPLCRGISDHANRTGLEVALKGGQVGLPSFFGAVKAGAPLS